MSLHSSPLTASPGTAVLIYTLPKKALCVLFLLTLQINCVTQGTGRTCGVIKSTSIRADIALQHPIQKDFKQPKPWHTCLWPRVQGRFAPPDLESKTARQLWERWLQPSCSWRTMANTRSIPATSRYTWDWGMRSLGGAGGHHRGQQEAHGAAARSGRTGQPLPTLSWRGEDGLGLMMMIKNTF